MNLRSPLSLPWCNSSDVIGSSLWLQLSESGRQFDVLRFIFIKLSPHYPSGENASPTLIALPDVCPVPGLSYLLGFLMLVSYQMVLCALLLPQAPGSKGLLLTTSGSRGLTHGRWSPETCTHSLSFTRQIDLKD